VQIAQTIRSNKCSAPLVKQMAGRSRKQGAQPPRRNFIRGMNKYRATNKYSASKYSERKIIQPFCLGGEE